MDGSDVFFPTGSFAGRPAFVLSFPPHHGGLALLAFSLPYSLAPRGSGYPGFERYYGGAKTPSPVSPAALASRLGGGPRHAGSLFFVRGTLRASGRRCCPRWPLVTRCRPLRVLVVDWEEGLPCSLGTPACCAAKFFDPAWPLPPRHGRRSGFVPDGPDCSGPRIVQGRRWNDNEFSRLDSSAPQLAAYASCRPFGGPGSCEHSPGYDYARLASGGAAPRLSARDLDPVGTPPGRFRPEVSPASYVDVFVESVSSVLSSLWFCEFFRTSPPPGRLILAWASPCSDRTSHGAIRVAREVALPRPHRTGRAVLQHPVPPDKGLARRERARCRALVEGNSPGSCRASETASVCLPAGSAICATSAALACSRSSGYGSCD